MDVAVDAALWVVGKALGPVRDGLLESWAASAGLASNIDALKMQLLYAQGMLDSARGRDEIRSPALKELLHKLRQLAYGADDALDELDYFCIQDALDGTYHAADVRPHGFLAGLAINARHTVGKHFSCYTASSSVQHDAASSLTPTGRRFLCGPKAWQTPRLKFDRVGMSTKIMDIVEHLKPLCAMVSTILNLELLGSSRIPTREISFSRPKTTQGIIEPMLYGRDNLKRNIVDDIRNGKYCADELNVLPIVGPGGIGKTSLVQHIYKEVESCFQVSIWICVSLDFNASRLMQEIVKKIPKVTGEMENASDEELIQLRLKYKRLLLVLDDMWKYQEDEWKKLLAPLRNSGGENCNMIIVTTRIPEIASMVSPNSSSIQVERLREEDMMSFFQVCVFGDIEQPWKDYLELHDIGKKIVSNLKGFPLAAKTVGRLLRNKLTLDHWTRIVESKEWELQTGPNDIMPALKLSFDYLPFHLQQCFSHCSLFPEDYEFARKELVHFWIGLGILHSRENERTEYVGMCYLDELVSHGFLKENKKEGGTYYVIHDLLHELAVNVSSYECLCVNSSNVRSIRISPSVRHLSITVDNADVKDNTAFENYKSNLSALGKRLEVQNIRTLMIFGEYHGSFVQTFRDLLREASALRAIYLSGASYSVEDMLLKFSELVHLRYLRIKSVRNKDMCLPSSLFRSYHLEVIDLEKWGGSFCLTSEITNLVKLRHFVVPGNNPELHSSICEVGKLKLLEELRRFEVGKETDGFELKQLGELTELGGSLCIINLDKVQTEGEGKELKLIHKNHLHELTLEWNKCNRNPPQDENVLESLVPHRNLQDLHITGHGGDSCPSWLGVNLCVENLESLSLNDVSWNKLPPLGDLVLIDNHGIECQGYISSKGFQTLKRLELVNIRRLKRWIGSGNCHLFSLLEVVIIKECSELIQLPFSQDMTWFPRLRELKIEACPKLSSLPPIPWTTDPCCIEIAESGPFFEKLYYLESYISGLTLKIKGKDGQVFWNVLALHNLADLKVLEMEKCPPLSLNHLQKLKSLKTLKITSMSNALLLFEGESQHVGCTLPVERVEIEKCEADGVELTQLLSHLPKLTELSIEKCEKITGLGVVEEHQAEATSSSESNNFEHEQTRHQQQRTRGKEELSAAAGRGLLLLSPQLQELSIKNCPELSNSFENGGRVLQRLCCLRGLYISFCPKLVFLEASFPPSLQNLLLQGLDGMETLAPLSNLMSLADLTVSDCGNLRSEGLWPLVAHGRLTGLHIYGAPKFFTGTEPSRPHDQQSSSGLWNLHTHELAGVLTASICSFLSSSLTKLSFIGDTKVERFTEEQEEALILLKPLLELEFWWWATLQRLPGVLSKLTKLKRLQIMDCPAIRSLPKDGLPGSLQELDVSHTGNSKELISQCRKLKGTIPIIRDYKPYKPDDE